MIFKLYKFSMYICVLCTLMLYQNIDCSYVHVLQIQQSISVWFCHYQTKPSETLLCVTWTLFQSFYSIYFFVITKQHSEHFTASKNQWQNTKKNAFCWMHRELEWERCRIKFTHRTENSKQNAQRSSKGIWKQSNNNKKNIIHTHIHTGMYIQNIISEFTTKLKYYGKLIIKVFSCEKFLMWFRHAIYTLSLTHTFMYPLSHRLRNRHQKCSHIGSFHAYMLEHSANGCSRWRYIWGFLFSCIFFVLGFLCVSLFCLCHENPKFIEYTYIHMYIERNVKAHVRCCVHCDKYIYC